MLHCLHGQEGDMAAAATKRTIKPNHNWQWEYNQQLVQSNCADWQCDQLYHQPVGRVSPCSSSLKFRCNINWLQWNQWDTIHCSSCKRHLWSMRSTSPSHIFAKWKLQTATGRFETTFQFTAAKPFTCHVCSNQPRNRMDVVHKWLACPGDFFTLQMHREPVIPSLRGRACRKQRAAPNRGNNTQMQNPIVGLSRADEVVNENNPCSPNVAADFQYIHYR